jgi:3-phenylpropionate/trans-cinnamate dioxygenase ferredoxin reductase subunit
LTGKSAEPYSALPWFWSDQGDLKLQIAGLSGGHDQAVVLGDIAKRNVSILCFRQGRLIAVESCNRSGDHVAARRLLLRDSGLTPAIARGQGFDLKDWETTGRQ